MLKLIIKTIIFILPLVMAAYFIERKIDKMQNSYIVKMSRFKKIVDSVDVLILGNSHAYYGISPESLSNTAYSMANVSQSMYYDKEILNKYLPSLKKLHTVVLPISYFTMENEITDGIEYWRCFNYERYYGIRPPARSVYDWFDTRKYSTAAMLGAEKTKKALANKLVDNSLSHISPAGWYMAQLDAAIPKIINGKSRIDYHHSIMKNSRIFYNICILNEVKDLAYRYNLKVIAVTLPVDMSYYSGIDKKRFRETQELVINLMSGNNLKYIDYSNDSRFDSNDFFDSDHLNANGALKFSKILANEIHSDQ
jgi:hypothetical protein